MSAPLEGTLQTTLKHSKALLSVRIKVYIEFFEWFRVFLTRVLESFRLFFLRKRVPSKGVLPDVNEIVHPTIIL